MSTMPDSGHSLSTTRAKIVVWLLAGIGWLLTTAFLIAWFLLPRWFPDEVMAYSPLYAPARQAALISGKEDAFLARLGSWQETALLDARQMLEGSDAKQAGLAFKIVKHLSPPEAADLLMLGIEHPDDDIFSSAGQAFGEFKGAHVSTRVIEQLERRPFQPALGVSHSLAPLMHSDDYPFTAALRSHADPERRIIAMMLVSRLQDQTTVSYLISEIGRCLMPWGQGRIDMALMALAENGSETALQRLSDEITRGERTRRLDAIYASQRQESERLSLALASCLDDPDTGIAESAMAQLVNRRGPSAAMAIERLITRTGPDADLITPKFFQRIADNHADLLVRHLDHPKHGGAMRSASGPV